MKKIILNKSLCTHLNQVRASGYLDIDSFRVIIEFLPEIIDELRGERSVWSLMQSVKAKSIFFNDVRNAFNSVKSKYNYHKLILKWPDTINYFEFGNEAFKP